MKANLHFFGFITELSKQLASSNKALTLTIK